MQEVILKMTEENARRHYPSASPELKALLEDTFGKKFFSAKIIDRVQSFEDACREKGCDPLTVLPYRLPSNDFEKALNALAKAWIIIEVINEDWKADLSNTSQSKYYPWFEQKPGFGLSYHVCVDWYSFTICGVRFALATAEKAIYVGKQFIDIYQEFSIIK